MNRSLDGYDLFNKSLTGLLDQGTTTLYQTVAGMSSYLTIVSASSIYQTIANMSNYVTQSTLQSSNFITTSLITGASNQVSGYNNFTFTSISSNIVVA